MLLYVAIGGLHQIPATIHNKDFVIHIAFLFFFIFLIIILHFMCLATMFSLLSFSDHPFKQENK